MAKKTVDQSAILQELIFVIKNEVIDKSNVPGIARLDALGEELGKFQGFTLSDKRIKEKIAKFQKQLADGEIEAAGIGVAQSSRDSGQSIAPTPPEIKPDEPEQWQKNETGSAKEAEENRKESDEPVPTDAASKK